ncbi:NDP-hexose 2,3-dehydratase family protein [Actinopolyspora mortivallis]|uniref:NDP-hexose 2,3-dehydratase family protein n=1 Tax=Actinopolyspora mortivallis TaxID=33906 RepID=UPI000A02FDDD|nr:NDP-hexose 2,3-dehydratase family protein [Actinopolyspora mortivallis]
MRVIDTVAELRSECQRRRNKLEARVLPIPLSDLRYWSMTEEGSLSHHTGRFFRVIGARVEDPSGSGRMLEQPIVDQPEVGVLCLFVTVIEGSYHGLVTFKFEPGTPDGIEVAPSVQATRSNYEAAHGGAHVSAVGLALSETCTTLADTVQREQEAWFLGKVNRNRIVLLDADDADSVNSSIPDSYWVPIPALLAGTLQSRLINMDLRSVLSMWPLDALPGIGGDSEPAGRTPTVPTPDPGPDEHVERDETLGTSPELVPLDSLLNWELSDSLEHRYRRFFAIVGCRVEGQNREKESWDQPLLAPMGMGQCSLLLRTGEKGLEMLVAERVRIGSVQGPTLEPTHQRGDVADYTTAARRVSMVAEAADLVDCGSVYSVVHAEEGGRFRGAIVSYQIGFLVDEGVHERAGRWVPLEEIESLNRNGNYLSVELRTSLVMLKGIVSAESIEA